MYLCVYVRAVIFIFFTFLGTLICFARSFKGLQSLIRADKSTAYSVTSRNASSGSPLTVSSYYVHDKVQSNYDLCNLIELKAIYVPLLKVNSFSDKSF